MSKKLILVIGATGAQGFAIIPALLAPNKDGTPSPYAVRALTRDPESKRAKELQEMGAELVTGSTNDIPSVEAAMEGCYGAFVNLTTDNGGQKQEIYSGIKIYEAAKRTSSMRHYIWSSLDYASKITNYNPLYKPEHFDGKAIVQEFIAAQPSSKTEDGLAWSALVTGPYMEMLNYPIWGPMNTRSDGTVVFAAPIQDGHMHMITLPDLAWWTRYTFDNRTINSGKELKITSDIVTWDQLVETFTRVTGKPAVHKRLTIDEWFANFLDVDRELGSSGSRGGGNGKDAGRKGGPTIRESFSCFWRLWRDDIIKRDLDWVRSVHPGTKTLEGWMRETGYQGGTGAQALLKNIEDGDTIFRLNVEAMKHL